MARKHTAFKTVLALGGVCAAGALIYKNRELIVSFLEELTGTAASSGAEEPEEFFTSGNQSAEGETDIVIDRNDDATAQNGEDNAAASGE